MKTRELTEKEKEQINNIYTWPIDKLTHYRNKKNIALKRKENGEKYLYDTNYR